MESLKFFVYFLCSPNISVLGAFVYDPVKRENHHNYDESMQTEQRVHHQTNILYNRIPELQTKSDVGMAIKENSGYKTAELLKNLLSQDQQN